MPRYLVTGGCGFIGSHLTAMLVASGAEVIVLDDLSTGQPERVSGGARLIVGDIRDEATVHRAFASCDACFHLAAIASVPRCETEWARSHDVNLGGAVRVFEGARDNGNVPVVYASSAAVYGDLGRRALAEHTVPAPISAYGIDKLGCELHARTGGRTFGLPTCGLRFFNVFGPGQDPRSPYAGAISLFAERLCQGRDIDIFGDGEQTRDYVYVADVVRALTLGLKAASAAAPVFNVCTGFGVSVVRLATQLFALRGCSPSIRFCAPRVGDVRHSTGDPSYAAHALSFRAEMEFAAGLEATLRHLERRAGVALETLA